MCSSEELDETSSPDMILPGCFTVKMGITSSLLWGPSVVTLWVGCENSGKVTHLSKGSSSSHQLLIFMFLGKLKTVIL